MASSLTEKIWIDATAMNQLVTHTKKVKKYVYDETITLQTHALNQEIILSVEHSSTTKMLVGSHYGGHASEGLPHLVDDGTEQYQNDSVLTLIYPACNIRPK